MLRFTSRLALTGALLLAAAASYAFPDKPIKIVVPSNAGTSTDVLARELAQVLSAVVKQPVVIENRTGAEGSIGAQSVARAEPDGYTLMFASSSLAVLDPLMRKTPAFDPLKDFTPVCAIAKIGHVLNMSSTLPYKTAAEFVAAAKAEPERFTYAYSSATLRLSAELFQWQAGIKLRGIPYRSSAVGLTEVGAGQVSVIFIDQVSAAPFYQSGKVVPLLVSGPERLKALPNVPSNKEAGVPGYELSAWFALFLPARTPTDVVKRLRDATTDALKSAPVRAMLDKAGLAEFPVCGDALSKLQLADMERSRELIKRAGIEPQ